MKRIAVLLFLIFLIASPAGAKYVQTAKAKYQTSYQWSQYYTVEVSFLTGKELNDSTRSFSYNAFSVYAVIFWGPGQASVIQLSGIFTCGLQTNQSCIQNVFSNLEGQDQEGRNWEICTKSYCF